MKGRLAHISDDKKRRQTNIEHCTNTAEKAAAFLKYVGLEKTGYCAGMIHDIGKFRLKFENYIMNGGIRGTVNHTFASVHHFMKRYHKGDNSARDLVAEILSCACASHHGLMDCVNEDKRSGYEHRLSKPNLDYDEVLENMQDDGLTDDVVNSMFEASVQEMEPILLKLKALAMNNPNPAYRESEMMFYCGLLMRLILSALTDADCQDTAFFMNGREYPALLSDEEKRKIWQQCYDSAKAYSDELYRKCDNRNLADARKAVMDKVLEVAGNGGGIIRFYSVCGSGKTMAINLFGPKEALSGEISNSMFLVMPTLCVIHGNAKVVRDCYKNPDIILECDSDVTNDKATADYKENYKQLAETWNSPIVITTAVQFLEALFDGSMRSIRRFHSLCNSIIVIDEVQNIPKRMLCMFSTAMSFLYAVCRSTVVLCSATQPCLEELTHPIAVPVIDMCPSEVGDNPVFRRTSIQFDGKKTLDDIGELAIKEKDRVKKVLVVCNKKSQARKLYESLKGKADAVYHMSGWQCGQHRTNILEQLSDDLKDEKKTVICVATQVMEAGVDVSFGSVIRFLAGLDSIIQAAGRCNRNGELGEGVLGIVHVVQCEGEKMTMLPDIQEEQSAMLEFLLEYDSNPDKYDNRMDSDAAVRMYYHKLYARAEKDFHDYIIRPGVTLYDLLSMNVAFSSGNEFHAMRQAFKTAGQEFHVFGGGRSDVIVPYGKGVQLIADLGSDRAKKDVRYLAKTLKAAKKYTVSLFDSMIEQLGGAVIRLEGGALGLAESHYDEDLGFVAEGRAMEFLDI